MPSRRGCRALRRVAGEHALAPEGADQAEAATRRFEATARDLEARYREHARQAGAGVSWPLADGLDGEQRAVAGLLDADASRLSPDSLARMRAHFAARIRTERARHRDLPYRELLASVLDYRRWRQFVLQLVSPEGGGGDADPCPG